MDNDSGDCNICGDGVLFGERHPDCYNKLPEQLKITMEKEFKERVALEKEVERLKQFYELGSHEQIVLKTLQQDMQEIICKCFKGKKLNDETIPWLTDCITTIITYHSYKGGVIPYPDEDEKEEE